MKSILNSTSKTTTLESFELIEYNNNQQLQNILTAFQLHLHSNCTFVALYESDNLIIKSTHGFICEENQILPIELQANLSETQNEYYITKINDSTANEIQMLWSLKIKPSCYLTYPLINKEGLTIGFLACLDNKNITIDNNKKLHLNTLALILTAYLEQLNIEKEKKDKLIKKHHKVVHDLRNPLTIISLHAELIKTEDNISDDTIEACDKIKEAIKQLSEIAFQLIETTTHN